MKKEKKKEPSERKPNWKEYTATVEDIEQFLSDNILLTDLGFRRMRSHGERGYIVVAYSPEEIKARQRMKACDAKPEDGLVDDGNDAFDANDTIF